MLVWLVLDYICDGVYILDIAVRLHTGTERDGATRLTFLGLCKDHISSKGAIAHLLTFVICVKVSWIRA